MVKKGYNPFNPNSVVVPKLFAGRSQQVLDITKKLSQLQHSMPASFFIHGERGIGKTAISKLIKAVSNLNDPNLYELDLISSYYSVERGQDLSSVLQASLNALTDQMDKSLIEEIGSRLGNLFSNGKFTIGAFGGQLGIEARSGSSQENDITIKDQTVSILKNILSAIREKHQKQGILIIIDEIHNLDSLQDSASVFRNISTTLDVDGLGQVAFLLIGYDEDVTTFFSQDSSARRTFDMYPLGTVPDDEAAEIITKGLEEASYTWDKEALMANIVVAGGYPHSIQVLGHQLIEADTDGHIDDTDWSNAIFQASQSLRSKEFSKLYSFNKTLTIKDMVLVYLAHSDKPLSRRELQTKTNSQNIYKELSNLKSIGAIKESEDKTFSMHSQLFKTAVLFDYFMRDDKGRKLPRKGNHEPQKLQ